MFSVLVRLITPLCGAFSFHSLLARHLVITAPRPVDLLMRRMQTDQSVSNHEWKLLVHQSATQLCIIHWSFCHRVRSLVMRITSAEQQRGWNSRVFTSRCLFVI